MAGIFDQLIRSKGQVLFVTQRSQPVDPLAMELQASVTYPRSSAG
jgi:hypothetical protein